MSSVYSQSRPMFGSGPETQAYKEMEDYAHKRDLQDLMHKMLTDVVIAKPEKPLEYMIQWLTTEKERRQAENLGADA